MNKVDFSQPGGFPLTQDTLGFLQSAYLDSFGGIGSVAGPGPVILSGLVLTGTGFGYTVSAGWLYANGEIFYSPGGGGGLLAFPNEVLINLVESVTPLSFFDGSAPNVIKVRTAAVTHGIPPSPPSTTLLRYNDCKRFPVALGEVGRDAIWSTLTVNTLVAAGGVTGTIFYKKNHITNTLQLKGTLHPSAPINFLEKGSGTFYSMGALTSSCTPSTDSYFESRLVSAVPDEIPRDSLHMEFMVGYKCYVGSDSHIYIQWYRPESGYDDYSLAFNSIIPLD